MSSFSKTADTLTIPLGLINMLSLIISGLWLSILGKWNIIGYGALVLFISIFGLVSALMPGMLFAGPAAAFNKKGKRLGFFIFGCLSTFYSTFVLSVWCITILYLFSKGASGSSAIPILFWSYGVATGPVLWLSQKDLQSGDRHATISTSAAQMASLLVILVNLFTRLPLSGITVLFTIVMSAALMVQFRITYKELNIRDTPAR